MSTPQGADKNLEACAAGWRLVMAHPMFAPLARHTRFRAATDMPRDSWFTITADGLLRANCRRPAEAAEWMYVLAHAMLHLGMGHFRPGRMSDAWLTACDIVVARFLADLKIGREPIPFDRGEMGGRTEQEIAEALTHRHDFDRLRHRWSFGGFDRFDMEASATADQIRVWSASNRKLGWEDLFAEGLRDSVGRAVAVAAGELKSMGERLPVRPVVQQARSWFIDHYPLLGAIASGFEIVDDVEICQRLDIAIAAVDIAGRVIYTNRAAGLREDEWRFVLAHEMLHAALRHDERRRGRDPFLWNCAADYVINAWLVDMQVGAIVDRGLLYDPQLAGLSAESIYDRLAQDLRRARKLQSLRGRGMGDMLFDPARPATPTDLDAFYRRALAEGLALHRSRNRGSLPAGLVEEIAILQERPIPWDVKLARRFDEWFTPPELRRSWARPSRRQASAPDIPRPRLVEPEEVRDGRVFGVVVDTSLSMDRKLLGRAVGAVAAYGLAREVSAVRLVYCDALPHDAGWVQPDDLVGRVEVRGRGGTTLQPGVRFLETAEDFPKDAPILIITDAECDHVRVGRRHAFLIPRGARLPFRTAGDVFHFD